MQVPAELRTDGLTVSFLNESGNTEKWEFGGGSWGTGSFSQVGAGKITELSDNVGLYNVDKNVPLGSGFYTSTTARAAVPTSVRKLGLIITYKTDATTSVTEQFIGSAVSAWTTETNWKNVGSEGGNKILEWNTDVAATRKQVLQKYRKPGIQISYLHPDYGWVNEQYIGTNISDIYWGDDQYWVKINDSNIIRLDYINSRLATFQSVPSNRRKKGIIVWFKEQRKQIINLSVGGFNIRNNRGGKIVIVVDGQENLLSISSDLKTDSAIAQYIAENITSDNWDISYSGSSVVFTSKLYINTNDIPYGYCYDYIPVIMNFVPNIVQFAADKYYVFESKEYFADNNKWAAESNWIEIYPSIIEDFSHYNPKFKLNPIITRMTVPTNYRKKGTVLSYYDDKRGVQVEEVYTSESTSTKDWADSRNWSRNGVNGFSANLGYMSVVNSKSWYTTSDYITFDETENRREEYTDYISVDENNLYSMVKGGFIGRDNTPRIMFYTEDKTIIPYSYVLSGTIDYLVQDVFQYLPPVVKYVRLGTRSDGVSNIANNILSSLREGDYHIPIYHTFDIKEIGYNRKDLSTTGEVLSSGALTSPLIKLTKSVLYCLTGRFLSASNGKAYCAFYNSDFKCISVLTKSDFIDSATYSGFIAPPEDAYYMIFAWYAPVLDLSTIKLTIHVDNETLLNQTIIDIQTRIELTNVLDYIPTGDSISQMGGSWVNIVNSKLGFKSITNVAIGGAGFTYAKSGIFWLGRELDNIPQGFDGVITIMGGINDWASKAELGSTEDALSKSLEVCYNTNNVMCQYRWFLETMINKCSWKVRIFIITQLERWPYVDGEKFTIEQLRVETEKLAAHYMLPVIDAGRKCGLRNGNEAVEDWRLLEGSEGSYYKVHPTGDGHDIIGAYVAGQIQSYLNAYTLKVKPMEVVE